MKLKLPELNHVNFFPVEGIALFIDRLTNRPVHVDDYATKQQAEGVKISFSRSAVENALPTLLGMGFCGQQASAEHGVPRSNVGIITEAWIDGDKLMVKGGIYGNHFPEAISALDKGEFGLCPSFSDVVFDRKNLPESISILHMTFTAVNILHPWATSFDGTKIWLTGKRSYVAITDTEQFEEQIRQRATLIDAA